VLARGAGGLSGPALRPVALAAVHTCFRETRLPLVGMGGVSTGRHALELLAAGASDVAVLFGVIGQASRSALLGMEAQGRLLKTGVAAAALSIALDFLLIPRWGAVGAAIANTTVQGTWALAIFIPLWRRLHNEPAPIIREVVAS